MSLGICICLQAERLPLCGTFIMILKEQSCLLAFALCLGGCSLVIHTPEPSAIGSIKSGQRWVNITALGGRTPVSQATGLSATGALVTLSWNPVSFGVADISAISGYNLYRGLSVGGENYLSPLAMVGINNSVPSYTDASVVAGSTYYYVVRALTGTSEVYNSDPDNEIKVIVPPPNLSLVHRWIANLEMCGLLGQISDRANNYQCPYTGPGGNGSYYDYGKSTLIDTVESGCNYSASAGKCGNANGCLGIGAPAGGIGVNGDIYYDRGSAQCYNRTAGVWVQVRNAASSALMASAAASLPGLPPLVFVSELESWNICQQRSVPGFPGAMRLPSRREQITASAWSPGMTDAQISSIENAGASLPVTQSCNSNSGAGLTFDNLAFPANYETLPATLTLNTASVVTGSLATANCVSRYGVQDLVGNVAEFTSEVIMGCTGAPNYTCTHGASLNPTNSDFNNLAFDGTAVPGGPSNPTNWLFSQLQFNATQFLPPVGMAIVASAASNLNALPIGTASGMFDPVKFHNNEIGLFQTYSFPRAVIGGGLSKSGTVTGRFYVHFDRQYNSTGTGAQSLIGFRCAIDAE